LKLVIGERYRHLLENRLRKLDTEVIWLPDNPYLDSRLAGHADLNVFCKESFVLASKWAYPYIVNSLTPYAVAVESALEQSAMYPADAGLCACWTGKHLIYNPRTADPMIPANVSGDHIAVKQGYTKCSVCVVSDDAIITSDHAVAQKAANAGLDVLEVSPAYVVLEGFDYGFIGGATFKINKRQLAFTGTLSEHPDKERIYGFLAKHGIEPVFLTNLPIFDIGGAVALP